MRKIDGKNILFVFLIILLTSCVSSKTSKTVSSNLNLAEAGNAEAQFKLGVAYDYGDGVVQNYQQAAYWYQQSANQGYTEAQNSLGSLYQAGLGVPKNYPEAIKWYQKASTQQHPEALNNLAYMYDLGLGVEQNRKKAFELYKSSAELGFVRAMLNLGVSYTQGEATKVSYVQAYKWLDLARFYSQSSRDMKLKWNVRGQLEKIEPQMTQGQIAEGQKLAKQWQKKLK